MIEISVIVPFYKPQRLQFRKCLDSLTQQHFDSYEIILVDDGNPEAWNTIAEEYSKNHQNVQVLHQKNGGVSAARNAGIQKASGKYIAFVDADDYVEKDYLSALYDAVQDCDLAICGIAEQYYPVQDRWMEARVFFSTPAVYTGLQYINFSVNKLYKAEIIKENNISFPVGVKLGEDAIFLSGYYKHCKSIRTVSDLLYHYVWTPDSAVHSFDAKYWDYEKRVIEKQLPLFQQYPLTQNHHNELLRWLYLKMQGVVFYYIDNMPMSKYREIIQQVLEFPAFAELKTCSLSSQESCLAKRERLFLFLMRKFGVRGAAMSYRIACKLHYRSVEHVEF